MDPHYPIGTFEMPAEVSSGKRMEAIREIASTPEKIRAALSGLNNPQLDIPYREGGWSVRQVVHHLADSHMNAYIRWRLALTEAEPTIKPYEENAWAKAQDFAGFFGTAEAMPSRGPFMRQLLVGCLGLIAAGR